MTRRVRRRVEGALVLLAFPVAVALTVLAISAPAGSGPVAEAAAAADAPSVVAIRGGEAVKAYAIGDRLSALGYDVGAITPDDKSFGPDTVVVYYDRAHVAEAERLRNLLGVGTIRREPVFSPSSDMTIFIGKDLRHT
ncbi:MAG TPA: LytR C-terminal domain-containing protein [Acidimicrobiales bacterium]